MSWPIITTQPIQLCVNATNSSFNICLPSMIIIIVDGYVLLMMIKLIKQKIIINMNHYDNNDRLLLVCSLLSAIVNLVDVLDGVMVGSFNEFIRLVWNFTILAICLEFSFTRLAKKAIIVSSVIICIWMVYYWIMGYQIPINWIVIILYIPIGIMCVHQLISIRYIINTHTDTTIISHLQTRQSYILNLTICGVASGIVLCFPREMEEIAGGVVTVVGGYMLYPFGTYYVYNSKYAESGGDQQDRRSSGVIEMEDYIRYN